jgi:hypothetical protein
MFRRNFPKNWKSSEHLTTRQNTLRLSVSDRANSRDYFVASYSPTRRDLLDCLHKAMVFWRRFSIAHQLHQSNGVYAAPVVPMPRASRSRCRFHRKPDRNPLVATA